MSYVGHHEENGLRRRFERRVLTLVAIGVFTILAAPFILGFLFLSTEAEQQRDLACLSAVNQIEQLTALRSISRTLGLPPTFTIPDLPEECR